MERGQQKLSLKRTIELCVLYKIKPGSVLDDCCDELIDLDEIHLEQTPDKRDTIGILEKSSDETVHLINLIAHTLYKDQKAYVEQHSNGIHQDINGIDVYYAMNNGHFTSVWTTKNRIYKISTTIQINAALDFITNFLGGS